MIKFSVVIPLYNKEKEIIDTIDSVLNQIYKAEEIIVVDDGSTDGSKWIVTETFSDQVQIISQKNVGVSGARNSGIMLAKNEYICLLDADDLWEKGFLKEIKKLIEMYPQALFYSTATKSLDENGNVIKNKISFNSNNSLLIDDFPKVFAKNYGIVNSSSLCIRKSYVDQGNSFPEGEKKGEDICYWLELSRKGSFAFSAKPLSIYKLNASNRSDKIHKEAIIPCPLKWFYRNKDVLKLEKNFKSIRYFIYSNIFITVYGGFALSNNYLSINAVIDLMKQNRDRFYLLLYPAYLMPVRLLVLIKKIRRMMR